MAQNLILGGLEEPDVESPPRDVFEACNETPALLPVPAVVVAPVFGTAMARMINVAHAVLFGTVDEPAYEQARVEDAADEMPALPQNTFM